MSLETLLRQGRGAGARELRLVAGRKISIVTPNGEREVDGPPLTAQALQQLIMPVMTPAARQAASAGHAEWTMSHPELGAIRAVVDTAGSAMSTTFFLEAAGPQPVSGERGVNTERRVPVATIATAEMDSLFRQMFEMRASDLHICVGAVPMVRQDGEIKPLPNRSVLTPADIERILLSIAPERNAEEFKRRNDTDFAYDLAGVSRFRCNLFRDRKGAGGVFRVIPSKIITAEQMNLSKEILELCFLSKGLVLVTGPTGSGKSTTLCALIDYINRYRTDHIITIEDPIEFVHENKKCLINQRQIGEHTDSFKDALRAALREDPDIVLVGEMRDLETVSIAIETAETGHLVFGTLHTSSAASTVDRIIDQFPADRQDQIRVMLASSLKGVISQMLCKKIGGGRVPALEVMIGTPPISNLIREAKIFQIPSIMQTSRKLGMGMMNDSFLDLVKQKIVEPQEAYAKAIDKTGLLSMFKANNIDTSFMVRESNAA